MKDKSPQSGIEVIHIKGNEPKLDREAALQEYVANTAVICELGEMIAWLDDLSAQVEEEPAREVIVSKGDELSAHQYDLRRRNERLAEEYGE